MRDEIRLAERLGISPRRLWGEPATYRIFKTEEGTQAVAVDEFTREDIHLFLAAKQAEESISPRGIPYEVELDKNMRFRVGDDKGHPSVNYAVQAQMRAERAYRKKYETDERPLDGFMWPVSVIEE